MRDTNDRDDNLELEAYIDEGRKQPARVGGKPEHKRKAITRRGAAPTSYNGMHRRRKKRVMW
ncbi:MAG: hypothetical protein WD875_06170 [Pirellulales bacterium]